MDRFVPWVKLCTSCKIESTRSEEHQATSLEKCKAQCESDILCTAIEYAYHIYSCYLNFGESLSHSYDQDYDTYVIKGRRYSKGVIKI